MIGSCRDRAKIRGGVKELNLGEVKLMDADGKVLSGAKLRKFVSHAKMFAERTNWNLSGNRLSERWRASRWRSAAV